MTILNKKSGIDKKKPAVQYDEGGGSREVVDSCRMQDLLDNLADGLYDVVRSYLESTPDIIKDMREAYARGDRDDLQRMAHALKSSSGIFGAVRMVTLCCDLETAARNNANDITDRLYGIDSAYAAVQMALNNYLPKN